MDILTIDHFGLNVKDLDASAKFYGEVLGWKEIPSPDFDFEARWFQVGDRQIHLIKLDPTADKPLSSNHHVALRVKDFDATQKELEAKNVEIIMGPIPRPDGPMQMFIADPDGYIIELTNANT